MQTYKVDGKEIVPLAEIAREGSRGNASMLFFAKKLGVKLYKYPVAKVDGKVNQQNCLVAKDARRLLDFASQRKSWSKKHRVATVAEAQSVAHRSPKRQELETAGNELQRQLQDIAVTLRGLGVSRALYENGELAVNLEQTYTVKV